MSSLSIQQLSIGYKKGPNIQTIQKNINLEASQGAFIALIGPNGCGKSTLIRTISGLQKPLSGKVEITSCEKSIHDMDPKIRAKHISLVLTDSIQLEYATVVQIVSMGRHPYTSYAGKLSHKDKTEVEKAIAAVQLQAFQKRLFSEMSDGERQRVLIARALAQDTPFMFLDEPTSFLDLPNRIETMMLLKKLASEWRKCLIVSTHEIDLAIRLADVLWLMEPRQGIQAGSPKEMTASKSLERAFQGNSFKFDAETGNVIIF